MDYYLYKRYSPFLTGGQKSVSESFSATGGAGSYLTNDPFTYTANKFIHQMEKRQPTGALDDLIDLRLHLARAKTELILAQVEQIRRQKEYNLNGITYDQLKVDNLILALSPQIYKDYRKLFDFYKRKLDLSREARTEETRFLRNTTWLGRELRQSLLELKLETEKRGFLSDLDDRSEDTNKGYTGGLNY